MKPEHVAWLEHIGNMRLWPSVFFSESVGAKILQPGMTPGIFWRTLIGDVYHTLSPVPAAIGEFFREHLLNQTSNYISHRRKRRHNLKRNDSHVRSIYKV